MEGLLLRRPLAVLDLETTGTSPAVDRIVEIAVLKLDPQGGQQFRCKRVNPGIPIPPEATAKHGITDADVANEPPFRAYARALHDFLSDCDLAGFGITRFDLPLLQVELRRAGLDFSWRDRAIVDAMAIFHRQEPRSLEAALRFYCEKAHPSPHSAEEDVLATAEVLRAQLARYQDLPRDVQALHEWCNPSAGDWVDSDGKVIWVDGVASLAFGKYRGTPLSRLMQEAPDYLAWILNGDFSDEVKQIVRNVLDGKPPQRGTGGATEPA